MTTTTLIIESIFNLIVLGILVAASVTDIKERKVPPLYQYMLLGTSVTHLLVVLFIEHNWQMALNCLLTGIFTFSLYIILVLIFKAGIGGADTKVTSLMALFLGWKQTLCFIIAHAVVALFYSVFQLRTKGIRVKSVPLMPFLAAGFIITKAIVYLNHFNIIQFSLL